MNQALKNNLTKDEFHKGLHSELESHKAKIKSSKLHSSKWIESKVNLKLNTVNITMYIDFKNTGLQSSEFEKLKILVKQGIARFWSQSFTISGITYKTLVAVQSRKRRSIDAKLKVSNSKKYARSHNSGIVDAVFYYNKGFFVSPTYAERDFQMTAAHEIGHSVLEDFGGRKLSWGHKGSTSVLTQKVKPNAPKYPLKGSIDLLKYYNNNPKVGFASMYNRTKVAEIDIKRLIWLSKLEFTL